MGEHHPHPPLLDQAPQHSSMAEPLNFSAPRLKSSPPATATISYHHHHSPCANCGFCGSGSHKRPLPTSSSSSLLFPSCDPQPKPKKLFLDYNDALLPSLPAQAEHSGANPFLLRRCVCDPYHVPPAPAADSLPGSGSGIFSNTCRSPENEVKKTGTPNSVTPCSATRPPPKLRRCISDPSPSPAKSLSRTSSSTDSKKLKKMWHCWKEMNSRMEEFTSEEEENDNEALLQMSKTT